MANRRLRGRIAHSLARTTKKGRGRIKKRSSYKRHMRKGGAYSD